MPPRLDNGEALPSYSAAFVSIFKAHPDVGRTQLARQLMLRSVRLQLSRSHGRAADEEQLSGFERGVLPLRVRPAFVILNAIALVLLSLLGFHPRAGEAVPLNDKFLHFICFFLATGLFYFIWDIDEPARRVWIWRHMPLMLTWIVCFVAGGLGSEVVQSALPYKTFQWGDVLANFIGSGLGLVVSYHAEKRHRLRREIQRLYEPLDQDLYGDEDEEGDETHADNINPDPWRSAVGDADLASRRQDTNEQNDSRTNAFSGEPDSSQPLRKIEKDTLFAIEDDDNEGESSADAWRDAR